MPARERHPTIFKTWNALAAGEALVLVNDHDPLPLYYQFTCEYPGNFRWDYLERGPETWRVRISRGAFADPGFVPERRPRPPAAAPIASAQPIVLDVRPIFARGETPCTAIDEAAARVVPGQSLVLLVGFEPIPLYAKLERQGFAAEPRQLEDGTWRIEFQRTAPAPAGPIEPVGCGCGH